MWPFIDFWLQAPKTMRALCIIVACGLALPPLYIVLVLVIFIDPELVAPLVQRPAMFATALIILAVGLSHLTLYLCRCARCSRQLFADDRRISLEMGSPVNRDYRARSFLFSYRNGAILQLARTGGLNCMWCGHKLGEKPDYVVTAPR